MICQSFNVMKNLLYDKYKKYASSFHFIEVFIFLRPML